MKKSKDYTLELIAIIGLFVMFISSCSPSRMAMSDEQCQCILDEDE